MKKIITTALFVLFSLATAAANQTPWFVPFAETEQGAIAILSHTYQNGASSADAGTDFDFRNQGGQELLFPFERYAVGATIDGRHRVWFTYQPLKVVTNVAFQAPVEVGTETFPTDAPMELTYSFPFYRITYTYDLLGDSYPNATLGVGLAVQLRNASIVFRNLDPSDPNANLYVSQNLGIVPALALYSSYRFPFGLALSADIAGTYASSAWFNGAGFEFEGSILDASLRMGYELPMGFELFGNLRFFGGTARGTSSYGTDLWTESTLKYTKNYIASLTASVGLGWSK